jgi:hypothetical protein
MACIITVQQPTGLSFGGVLTSITVQGTISDGCPGGKVVVEVACAGKTSVQAIVVATNWFAYFPNIQNLGCVCDTQVTVTAKCVVQQGGTVPQPPVVQCEGQFVGTLICKEGCNIGWGIPQIGDCLPDGKRPVTLSVTVSTGSPDPVQAQLELLGTGVVDLEGPTPGFVVLTFQGNLDPASYTFKVFIFQPDACQNVTSTVSVDVPQCVPQPTGACCIPLAGAGQTFTCEDGLTAAQCQAKGGTYMGDGTTCAGVDCTPNGNGNGNGGNGGGTPGNGGCIIGRWLVVFLIALAMFLAMLLLCMPSPQLALIAAAAVVAAGIAFGIWWFFCGTPCGGWLISWQSTFVVAIVALFLTGCCVQLIVVAVGLAAVAAGFYAFWIQNCKPDECEVLKETAAVFVIAAAPALDIITQLAPCGLFPVVVFVGVVGAGLTAAALAKCP